VPRPVGRAIVVGLTGDDHERISLIDIRAAELTADHLGRTIRIDPGGQDFAIGRLIRIRHRQAWNAETKTRLELEVVGNQRITLSFDAIGVIELL
jgi:hypothetical protein